MTSHSCNKVILGLESNTVYYVNWNQPIMLPQNSETLFMEGREYTLFTHVCISRASTQDTQV